MNCHPVSNGIFIGIEHPEFSFDAGRSAQEKI